MMEKIKTGLSLVLILLLFPYVAVMLSGQYTSEKSNSDRVTGSGTAAEQSETLEHWVLEILPGQMPVSYEPEALKAQAVIIRSNLMFRMEEEGIDPSQITEELLESWEMKHYSLLELQEIWGEALFEEYYEKIYRAVEETRGKVWTYEGRYVDLPYHAVSAGRTREGSLLGENYVYLKSVECPGDLEAENYLTVLELELDSEPEILSRDASDYVTEIHVGEERMAGETFRRREGLPSSCFTLQKQGEACRITTKGLGHGFGLSMYQAQLQALEGRQYFEILQYFYEGTECISFS